MKYSGVEEGHAEKLAYEATKYKAKRILKDYLQAVKQAKENEKGFCLDCRMIHGNEGCE